MIRDEENYQLATQFRKRGFSYTEIAKICGVSKATVSAWLSKKAFSKKVKKDNVAKAGRENAKRIKLLHKARQAERTARYREAVRSAETEYKHYKSNPLFVAGLMLYRTSGDLIPGSQIRLSTTDETAHRIFCKFAVDFLGVPRDTLKCSLILYSQHNQSHCEQHWQKTLKLKSTQLYKTQILKTNQGQQPLHFGVGNTIIGSTVLKRKLLRWIDLAATELAK